MSTKKYKVTCLNCNEFDVLTIADVQGEHRVIDYDKKMNTPFRSFRWRGDWKWGFYCGCGNDNRLAKSEEADFDKLVNGDPLSLQRITDSLEIPDELQFRMETI